MAPAADTRVTMEQLLLFVFPEALQHSQSSSRLIILALYGPLKSGKLLSGQHSMHCLGTLSPAAVPNLRRSCALVLNQSAGAGCHVCELLLLCVLLCLQLIGSWVRCAKA